MRHLDESNLDAAERFVWHAARLLERVRFAHLFRTPRPARVRAALTAYQNDDGGFGEGLEPDFRGPMSQPLCTELALRVLDELGTLDAPCVASALAHLARVTAPDGGVPNVLTFASDFPRAPWWQPDPAQPGSLLPTASIAGLLHKHGVPHAWLGPATDFCWQALSALPDRLRARRSRLELMQALYEARASMLFLDHVPERARAERVAAELGAVLLAENVLQRAPDATAEAAAPLDFAVSPTSLARRWLDDATLERHLDALVAAQGADGGWPIAWQVWTPSAGLEWRALQTLERLKTLRAYGRFPS
jgi:hypothetical protein